MALTDNLTNYWKFDESSGNPTDSVGGFSLTNTNSATYEAAKINNGITGNGTNSYLTNTTTTPFSYTQAAAAWSINVWCKRLANPAGAAYLYRLDCQSGSNQDRQIILYYYAAGGWHLNFGSGGDVALTNADNTTDFRMYTVTYNGSGTAKFYVNGTQSGSNISLTTTAAAGSSVGFGVLNDPNTGAPFNATADELGIWTRELTANEVYQLYGDGAGSKYPLFESMKEVFMETKQMQPTKWATS